MQGVFVLKSFYLLVLSILLSLFLAIFSYIAYKNEINFSYFPVHSNATVYYKQTSNDLGMTKDVFLDKLEQYLKERKLKLAYSKIVKVDDNFNDMYCKIASKHSYFCVNALYDIKTQKLKHIAVYSPWWWNDLIDEPIWSCMLYFWSCINTKDVSKDDLAFLKPEIFFRSSFRIINGFMVSKYYSCTRTIPRPVLVLSVDTTDVREKMNHSYIVDEKDK